MADVSRLQSLHGRFHLPGDAPLRNVGRRQFFLVVHHFHAVVATLRYWCLQTDRQINQIKAKYDFNNGRQTATWLQPDERDKIAANKRQYR